MQLREVILHNVGTFLGRHTVDLSVTTADRPVVLLGGLNGGGKTTFLEALQLGLYGSRAKTGRRGGSSYENYLESLINDSVDVSEGASIEIAFREFEDGGPVDYRVVRTWKLARSRVAEQLEIYVDNALDSTLSEHWNETVEHFLPQKLCNLFFFDGEQIEALADPDQSQDILETAISSLLGLELVDQLSVDLQVTKRTKIKEKASVGHQEQLETVEGQMAESQAEIDVLEKKRAGLAQKLGSAQNRLERANRSYERQGGGLLEKMKALEREKLEIETKVRGMREELRHLASGALPLALVANQLDRLRDVASKESGARVLRDAEGLIECRDKRLLEWLKDAGVEDKTCTDVGRKLSADRLKAKNEAEMVIQIDLPVRGEEQVGWLLEEGFPEVQTSAKALQDRLLKLQDRLAEVESTLVRVPEEASLSEVIQEREQAKHTHAQTQGELEDTDLLLDKRRVAHSELESKREMLEKEVQLAGLESELHDRIVSTTDMMVETMTAFRSRVLKRHLGRLENLILESYTALLRKQNLISDVRICPETLTLSVADRRGESIPSYRLSAGERQLLATSILWGLAKASGRTLPVVVDTPLGRLDASHRHNLIEHYFPNASHQVILLSTDEEIDGAYYHKLQSSLSGEYEIYFDEERGGSGIRSGYPFEEAA